MDTLEDFQRPSVSARVAMLALVDGAKSVVGLPGPFYMQLAKRLGHKYSTSSLAATAAALEDEGLMARIYGGTNYFYVIGLCWVDTAVAFATLESIRAMYGKEFLAMVVGQFPDGQRRLVLPPPDRLDRGRIPKP